MNQEDEDFLESFQTDEDGRDGSANFTDETIPGIAAGIFDAITIRDGEDGRDGDIDDEDGECKCPPPGITPDENPTNQEAFKTQMDLARNLAESQKNVSASQKALNEAQAAAKTNTETALAQFNRSKSILEAANKKKNMVDKQSCRASDALRNLNEVSSQRSNLSETMKTLAEKNVARMNNFGIPLSAPAGGVGSPTLKNAIRCFKSKSEGPNCGWFDSDKASRNMSEWNAMLKDYQSWNKYRKQVQSLNKKIERLHKTYAAAYSTYAELAKNAPDQNQLAGLEESARTKWTHYQTTVEQANESLQTSFNNYKSDVGTYNGIAAQIVSVTSVTKIQEQIEIQCAEDVTKFCPADWVVDKTETTPSAPGQLQVDSIDFISPIEQPEIIMTSSSPCVLGNLIPLPNVPDIGVGSPVA